MSRGAGWPKRPDREQQPWRLCLVDNLSQKVETSVCHSHRLGGSLGSPSLLSAGTQADSQGLFSQAKPTCLILRQFFPHLRSCQRFILHSRWGWQDGDPHPHWSEEKIEADRGWLMQGHPGNGENEPLLADVTAYIGTHFPSHSTPRRLTNPRINFSQPMSQFN